MSLKSVIPEPKIVDPEGKQLGPAMTALNLREQMFVMLLFEQPTAIKAFEAAGFTSTTRKALGRMCSYYSALPRIQAAIREEDARHMVLVGAEAQQALQAMVRNPQHQDHFKAVKLARDDAGLTKPVAKVIDMNVSISTEEKVQRIRAWAVSRGLDVEKLLGFDPGPPSEAVDVEFTEVPADEAWRREDIAELLNP